MKRTAPRHAAFRRLNSWLVLATCIGAGSSPAHAAGLKPVIDAGSHSMYTLEVINDTRGHIDSISIAPAGTNHWTNVDFRGPMQDSSFDYGLVATLEIRDDDGCLRDLRTVLSNGRRLLTRNFDLCHAHAYRPGLRFFIGQDW